MGNVTAQAELADMLFTHACGVLKDRVWHVELRPHGDWRNPECYIVIKVYARGPGKDGDKDDLQIVNYVADTRATMMGAAVSVEILSDMVDHHLSKVMKLVEVAEAGNEAPPAAIDPSEYASARSWLASMRLRGVIGARSAARALSDVNKTEQERRMPPDVVSGYAHEGVYSKIDIEEGFIPKEAGLASEKLSGESA